MKSELDDLKQQYLDLQGKKADIWWRQGQLLIQIKEKVPHGKWVSWMESNLHIDKRHAQRLMQIGKLPELPKNDMGVAFRMEELEAAASIAKREKTTLDEAMGQIRADAAKDSAANKAPTTPRTNLRGVKREPRDSAWRMARRACDEQLDLMDVEGLQAALASLASLAQQHPKESRGRRLAISAASVATH